MPPFVVGWSIVGGGVEASGLHKNGGYPHVCMVGMQLQLLILCEGFPHQGYVCIIVSTIASKMAHMHGSS
jgi:hypothetical protein